MQKIAYIVNFYYFCGLKWCDMRKILSLIVIACACVCVYAQEAIKRPDLQTADGDIFDPTRKEVKAEDYTFSVEYRFEIGYAQNYQWSRKENFMDMFFHGGRVGATFDFMLPKHFSMQTGLLIDLTFGKRDEHWRSLDAPSVQEEFLTHRILQSYLTIPVRVYYNIPLWKQLNMFFFTGPQLGIGLTEHDFVKPHLSAKAESWLQANGYETEEDDRLSKEVSRVNIQWGVGGGLEWDKYRLQAGYQFGLNNMVRKKVVSDQHMWQWGWFVTFCYRF